MPVCFYHVKFLKDFFRGGFHDTTHLHNIDVVFIKCASKCFFVIYSSQGFIVTFNETFVRKGLMNIQKLLLVFIPFSLKLSKCFFKDFLCNDTHMFVCFLYANTFSLEGF